MLFFNPLVTVTLVIVYDKICKNFSMKNKNCISQVSWSCFRNSLDINPCRYWKSFSLKLLSPYSLCLNSTSASSLISFSFIHLVSNPLLNSVFSTSVICLKSVLYLQSLLLLFPNFFFFFLLKKSPSFYYSVKNIIFWPQSKFTILFPIITPHP